MSWVCLLGIICCFSGFHSHAAEQKVRVLTTFLPLYSFAVNVAGNFADVQNLLPGAIDLHDYQLSPADLKKISEADLIIANGLGLEPFLERAMKDVSANKILVRASDGLQGELIKDDKGFINPHIWLDPSLAAHTVTNIVMALRKADPHHATDYQENARRYIAALSQMDADISSELQMIQPVAFITQHHAFEYFARHYHLRLVAVVEHIPEVNPTPRQLAKLHQTIRVEQVRALFVPPGIPGALERQICKDSGIRLGHLDPLETGELSSGSYEAGMRKNATRLQEGLRK